MSTKDAHECVCGHTRRHHDDNGCDQGCGCSRFVRKRHPGPVTMGERGGLAARRRK